MLEKSILRIRDITQKYGISRSTVYREIKRGRFPIPVKVTDKISGWRAEDMEAWSQGLKHRKSPSPQGRGL